MFIRAASDFLYVDEQKLWTILRGDLGVRPWSTPLRGIVVLLGVRRFLSLEPDVLR